eukprot:TRINITY_DN26225_c0_g1_i1.p5 TRINITY_DN26225_c0_g1~~TRINITY_DN26225_c0_g1_i1.p5  ORF type:complete len:103 (+),score=2.81 TRINITY_DN26225_c0_g1_i1:43-309(+)
MASHLPRPPPHAKFRSISRTARPRDQLLGLRGARPADEKAIRESGALVDTCLVSRQQDASRPTTPSLPRQIIAGCVPTSHGNAIFESR